ncbi:MAG: TetR/AcrR family transcriptional regulator [Myxococcota bacterium]
MPGSRSGSSPRARRRPGRPSGAQSGETRETILAATRALLAERGLPRVTLRAVAKRAGVQPALVTYYFGSKRALLREVVLGVAARIRDDLRAEAVRPGDPSERIANVMRAMARIFVEHPYAPRLLFEQVMFAEDGTIDEFVETFARPNLESMRDLLTAGHASGQLRELDPVFFAPQLIGLNTFFYLAEPLITRLFDLDGIDRELAERFAASSAELLLHGVLARPPEVE